MSGSSESSFFSVITPTFNRARTIRRAIMSMRSQTFDDWEYIIIDDGSTDDTFSAISDLLESDPRITYHYSVNQGTSKARDLGCSLSHGRYFTFLDSDDEYLPNHLESRYNILSHNPAIELLHGGVEIVGDEFVADKFDTSKRVHLSECAIGGTFVIRRDLWKRIGGFGNITYGDDIDFFSRAEDASAFIKKTDIPTYRYIRTEDDSLCNIAMKDGVEGIYKFRNAQRIS
ncbi:MAG TPA: glycosyltransferase family A protein [Candidatus Kapabacteria bacterium]|nr:glycosyltransferase family A protein [Candidatus Kapabacteria bacterium]